MTYKQFQMKQLKRDVISFLAVIAILLCYALSSKAQSHLPDTITIRISSRDLFAISQRVDSLQNIVSAASVLPANQITAFNQRLNLALQVMYIQVQRQMVTDKPKAATKPVKKE